MSTALESLSAAGVLAPLDVHLARTLAELAPDEPASVLVGAALTSRAVRNGHVCLDLDRVMQHPPADAEGHPVQLPIPGRAAWALELSTSRLVSAGERPTPLVFDGGARLYLSRYFHYQRRLADNLRARVQTRPPPLDGARLREGLDRLLPTQGDATGFTAHPQQRLAALVAAIRGLTVISGGPGTGKTTTVVRILALLQEQALAQQGRPLSIRLLAPTGKAAARLVEAIAAGKRGLRCTPEVSEAIPEQASTIHRALGWLPHRPTRFRHDATDPLPADVVLVDEASMVDLALMAKLLEAIAPRARVILLGDKNQLASVEAGAILGDICNAGAEHAYSASFADEIAALVGERDAPACEGGPAQPGIWDCIVELTHSYRFSDAGGIGGLARAVGSGNSAAVLDALGAPVDPGTAQSQEVALVSLEADQDPTALLRPGALAGLAPVFRAAEPAQRLAALSGYRVLAAHRRGSAGVERLVVVLERLLERAALIPRGLAGRGASYDGRPVLVTKNDYQLDLYNGDTGVEVAPEGGEPGGSRVYFPASDGSLRAISPHRLPPHETVLAMTVHKSQGSEFSRVALVVPPSVSPILTRELIYTAVTRARDQVVVLGSPRVVAAAVARRIERASGLREALWGR